MAIKLLQFSDDDYLSFQRGVEGGGAGLSVSWICDLGRGRLARPENSVQLKLNSVILKTGYELGLELEGQTAYAAAPTIVIKAKI
jgi:hypothetical protein